ncbi:hypothetical protein ACFL6S_15410 [Candidatus Poribacteria bacterium]
MGKPVTTTKIEESLINGIDEVSADLVVTKKVLIGAAIYAFGKLSPQEERCTLKAYLRFLGKGREYPLSTQLPSGIYRIIKTRKELVGHPIKILFGAAIFRFLEELTSEGQQLAIEEYLRHLRGNLFQLPDK